MSIKLDSPLTFDSLSIKRDKEEVTVSFFYHNHFQDEIKFSYDDIFGDWMLEYSAYTYIPEQDRPLWAEITIDEVVFACLGTDNPLMCIIFAGLLNEKLVYRQVVESCWSSPYMKGYTEDE